MMENTCMNQLQFTRNPQKRDIVMKTEMKVTLTRYILIPKCQAENACFIYPSMEEKDILKIPTEILAHFIWKLFFILPVNERWTAGQSVWFENVFFDASASIVGNRSRGCWLVSWFILSVSEKVGQAGFGECFYECWVR